MHIFRLLTRLDVSQKTYLRWASLKESEQNLEMGDDDVGHIGKKDID